MDTEELIKRCIGRDHTAWNEFVRRYEDLLIRSVRYKLKKFNLNVSQVEFRDIVQEIFLAIWEDGKLSGIRDIACLKNWLVMVSINKTSNYCRDKVFRKPKKALSFEEDLSAEASGITLRSIIPCDRFNPEKEMESKEIQEALEAEISKLNYRQQLALKLNIYEGRKHRDIADIMNIPENTVATLIHRARNRIRGEMEKYFERNSA